MTELAEHPPASRKLAIGYGLYLCATLMFSLNGTVVKTILLSGVSATRLSEFRATGAFLILLVVVAIIRPRALRIRRDEWKILLAYGVIGVSLTQFLYFVAIERIPISVGLILEFTAPIYVVLWARFGQKQPVRSSVWLGLALAIIGMCLAASIWQGLAFDGVGIAAGIVCALALALYYVLGEHQRRGDHPRDAMSLTMWGLGGAALFWAIAQPWWSFPWSELSGNSTTPLAYGLHFPIWSLATYMVILGTVVPFTLVTASLAYISASQASIVGMTEPLFATLIAWVVLGESLTLIQILGCAIVLVGVYIAERSR